MSKTYKDQRNHRRRVAGTKRGLLEHTKRSLRRNRILNDEERLVNACVFITLNEYSD